MATLVRAWGSTMTLRYHGAVLTEHSALRWVICVALLTAGCLGDGTSLVLRAPTPPAPVWREVATADQMVWRSGSRHIAAQTIQREVQMDGRWIPADDRLLVSVSPVDDDRSVVIRFQVVAAPGDRIGGIRWQLRIVADDVPQDPEWTQIGYAKYSATGIARIRDPLPSSRGGAALDELVLADHIDVLAAGVTWVPQVGWWGSNIRVRPDAPLVGIWACSAHRLKTRLAVGRSAHAVDVDVVVGGTGDALTAGDNGSVDLESICLGSGWFPEQIDRDLAEQFQTTHTRRLATASPLTRFFSTWHADFAQISLPRIRDELDALEASGYLTTIDAFQVDDGYQRAWGDWLTTAADFGGTVTELAAVIRGRGLKAGLWLTPSLAAPDSRVAREHPDWFLHDRKGGVLTCTTCSLVVPEFWILDYSIPEVSEWIEANLIALRAAGFTAFKVDFLAASAAEGIARDPATTALDRYHRMLAAVRRGVGDAFVWSATFPIWPTLGALDAYRLAGDLGYPFFPALPTSNRFHYARALAVRGTWLSKFGLLEPDAFFARNEPDAQRVESLAVLSAMAGGLYSVGDRPEDLVSELRFDRLPARLASALGSGRPWVAADPFAWPSDPWLPTPVLEEYVGTDAFATAQDGVYFRTDGTSVDVVLLNWRTTSTRQQWNLCPVLARVAASGDEYLLEGSLDRVTVDGCVVTASVPGLGARLVRLTRRPIAN